MCCTNTILLPPFCAFVMGILGPREFLGSLVLVSMSDSYLRALLKSLNSRSMSSTD